MTAKGDEKLVWQMHEESLDFFWYQSNAKSHVSNGLWELNIQSLGMPRFDKSINTSKGSPVTVGLISIHFFLQLIFSSHISILHSCFCMIKDLNDDAYLMKQALRNMPIWALSWINNISLLKFYVIFLFPILWFLIIFFKGDTIICWRWYPITVAIYFYEPLVPLFKTSIPSSFITLFYNSYKSKLSLALPITFSHSDIMLKVISWPKSEVRIIVCWHFSVTRCVQFHGYCMLLDT